MSPPVVIVGGGPVGLVAGLLLGQRGQRCVVLERDAAPFALPRAAHLDDAALRVFQQLGVLDVIAPHLSPTSTYVVTDRDGAALLSIVRTARPQGHPQSVLCHQPSVEAALRTAAWADPLVDLRTGWEVMGLHSGAVGPSHVVARSPDRAEVSITASAILGCDGAASTVRRLLGVGVADRGFDQRWLVVDLLLDRRPAALTLPQQRCDPSRASTSVPMGPGRHRIEVLLHPAEAEADMLAPARVRAFLGTWLDPETVTVERAAVYAFHALAARRWRVGETFLLGDAAHQMPPFLGQGLCAGIRDAANLAWKLAQVLAGAARPELLDTYAEERAPHVAATTARSVALGRLVTGAGPVWELARRGVATSVGALPPLRRRVEGLRPPALPAGPLVVRPRRGGAGDPLPQPALDDGTGARPGDALLGPGFALVGLGVDPLDGADPAAGRIWAALGARRLAVVPPGAAHPVQPPAGLDWVDDPSGALAAWFRAVGADRAVVRPDRVVLGVARDGAGIEELTARLARLL